MDQPHGYVRICMSHHGIHSNAPKNWHYKSIFPHRQATKCPAISDRVLLSPLRYLGWCFVALKVWGPGSLMLQTVWTQHPAATNDMFFSHLFSLSVSSGRATQLPTTCPCAPVIQCHWFGMVTFLCFKGDHGDHLKIFDANNLLKTTLPYALIPSLTT